MAMEGQQRGIPVKEVFGDYQQFCDEIVENAPRESLLEILTKWLSILLGVVIWCIFCGFLLSQDNTITSTTLTFSSHQLVIGIVYALIFMCALYFVNRNIFQQSKQKLVLYVAVCMVIYIIIESTLSSWMGSTITLPIVLAIGIVVIYLISTIAYFILRHNQYKKYKG